MENVKLERAIDELGRIVLPKEFRKHLSLWDDEPVELKVSDTGEIAISKINANVIVEIDEVGRISLPQSWCVKYGYNAGDTLDVWVENDVMKLSRHS